jgi:hypothetical protein
VFAIYKYSTGNSLVDDIGLFTWRNLSDIIGLVGFTFKRAKNAVIWRFKKFILFIKVSPLMFQRLPENIDAENRDRIYDIFTARFYRLPKQIRVHRSYFVRKRRGFGEDAFHSAWFYILGRFRPKRCLEIGVYRGQTLSLWSLAAKNLNFEIEVVGISPLTSAGDSVSTYISLDYRADIFQNFDKFKLPPPILVEEYSQNQIAKDVIELQEWDLIYIDGSHEFDVCLSDVLSSEKGLKVGGLLVIDDSSLFSDFSRSFKGHPGPSKVVSEFLPANFKKLLSVGHNNFYVKTSS